MDPETVVEVGQDVGWADFDKTKYLLYNSLFVTGMELVCYPADLLKTRQQWDRSADPRHFRLSKLAKDVLRDDGLRGFYRGITVNLGAQLPGNLLYFGGYELTKHYLSNAVDTSSQSQLFTVNLAAGFAADVVALLAFTPGDVITQRMMVSTMRQNQVGFSGHPHVPPCCETKHAHSSPLSAAAAVRAVLKHEGYTGLYRGLVGSAATYAPASAVWWATYEACKHQLHTHRAAVAWFLPFSEKFTSAGAEPKNRSWDTTVHLLSGAAAGSTGAIVTNPMDVAKTRYQTLESTVPADAELIR